MVKLYRYRVYDGAKDEQHIASRWATKPTIDFMKVGILEDTGVEVQDDLVAWSETEGLTVDGFDANVATGKE